MKKIDVIIPSYKPGDEFRELLKRLNEQTCSPDRIIIMNTEKEYWNTELEKQYDNIEVYHIKKSEFDHGATRAKAAAMSHADILVFMTQDAMPANTYLIEELTKNIRSENQIGAAYARQLPKSDCNFLEKYTRSFNYPQESFIRGMEDIPNAGIKTFFCSNVCAAYDKKLYDALGGFVHKAIFNEDMIYAGTMVKRGYKISYESDALVYHSHNYSCRQQMHRNFDLGVSQAEHPEIFSGISSEGEGMKLVKKSLEYLWKTGHFLMIPHLFFQSGFKYLGYFLGKRYKKLPQKLILYMTMNPEYWKK